METMETMETLPQVPKTSQNGIGQCLVSFSIQVPQYSAASEFVWTLCTAQYVSINFLARRLHKVFGVVYAKAPRSGVYLHHLNAQKKLL